MEKKHLALAALMIGFTTFQACKKSDSSKNNNNTVSDQKVGQMYCTVDGKAWGSDAPGKKHSVHYQDSSFSFDEDVYGTEGNIFGDTITLKGARVLGTDSSELYIEFVLNKSYTGAYTFGSYPVKNAGKAYAYYYNKLGQAGAKIGKTGYVSSGTLNITNYADTTGLISGNFSVTITPKNSGNPKTPSTHTITNGKFVDVLVKP